MPHEITIKHRQGAFGSVEQVQTDLSKVLEGITFFREPTGLEKIKAGEKAGAKFPDVIRRMMLEDEGSFIGSYEEEDFSVVFDIGSAEPIDEIIVEIRGKNYDDLLAKIHLSADWIVADPLNP